MAEMLEEIQAAELDLDRDLARYPDLVFALGYWTGKRHDRLAPARSDIDPLDITALLPRIMLADVVLDAGGRVGFRYRLSGTGIGRTHGSELTGQGPLDLRPAPYGALIDAHYRQALKLCRPLVHVITLRTNKKTCGYARIILPLSSDGESIDMLMIVDSDAENTLHEFLETIEALGKRT
jgi:hypothetical protein